MLTREMHDHSSLIKVICFIWSYWYLLCQRSNKCYLFQLTVTATVSRRQKVWVITHFDWLLKNISLRGILIKTFWLAESSRKPLLLAWDISLSKINVPKELRLWSPVSFTFYAQCVLDAAVGATDTSKAVSLATSAVDKYGVQIKVNKTSHSPLMITSILHKTLNDELAIDQLEEQILLQVST